MAKLSNLLSKRIPTILGILFLVAGLGVGIFIVGQGTGGFLPKASPESTPKNLKTTNISDSSFTVSFVTDSPTPGYIKYGVDGDKLNSQTSDDRDQLSGTVGQFTTHHITLRSLSPSTTYYFAIGTASREIYTDGGKPYSVTTAPKLGSAPEALTIYGSIITKASTPASDSIVYISIDGASPLSTLVKSSGSWAIPLSTARTSTLNSYAQISDQTQLSIFVQGKDASSNATARVLVAKAQPVPTITLGQSEDFLSDDSSPVQPADGATSASSTPPSAPPTPDSTSKFSDSQLNPPSESSSSAVASLGITFSNPANEGDEINSVRPALQGTAPAKTKLTIVVHSTQEYQGNVTTDANGNWSFTPPGNLDPGDHTVTVSYTDANGQPVSETRTFKVLAMNTSTNPAFTSTPSATIEPSPSPISSSSARTTNVGSGSAVPESGSTEETLTMLVLGLGFMIAGLYAWRKVTVLSLDEGDSHTLG